MDNTSSSTALGYSTVEVTAMCMEGIFLIVICFGNGLVLLSFCGNIKLRGNVRNYYVVQVAVADFAVGLLMPMRVAIRSLVLSNLQRFIPYLLEFSSAFTTALPLFNTTNSEKQFISISYILLRHQLTT